MKRLVFGGVIFQSTPNNRLLKEEGEKMIFSVSAALLDTLVLRVVDERDSYGYEISQTLRDNLGISESTLYPVLRRLQRDDCLEVYDVEYSGRNRRYYRITEKGRSQLQLYIVEWLDYKDRIDRILFGGKKK